MALELKNEAPKSVTLLYLGTRTPTYALVCFLRVGYPTSHNFPMTSCLLIFCGDSANLSGSWSNNQASRTCFDVTDSLYFLPGDIQIRADINSIHFPALLDITMYDCFVR